MSAISQDARGGRRLILKSSWSQFSFILCKLLLYSTRLNDFAVFEDFKRLIQLRCIDEEEAAPRVLPFSCKSK